MLILSSKSFLLSLWLLVWPHSTISRLITTYFKEVRLLYRVLGLVVIVLMALGMMLTTDLGRTVWSFVLESKQEVRKVVWPTREETMRTTLLVFAMVFIVGLILWLLDMFLFWGVRLLTGQGG